MNDVTYDVVKVTSSICRIYNLVMAQTKMPIEYRYPNHAII